MPALSPTMEQGKIVHWKVKEGQEVQEGDALAEVETDKTNLDFEIQDSGFIAKLLVGEGDNIFKVGTPVLILVQEKGDVEKFKNYKASGEEVKEKSKKQKSTKKEEK